MGKSEQPQMPKTHKMSVKGQNKELDRQKKQIGKHQEHVEEVLKRKPLSEEALKDQKVEEQIIKSQNLKKNNPLNIVLSILVLLGILYVFFVAFKFHKTE